VSSAFSVPSAVHPFFLFARSSTRTIVEWSVLKIAASVIVDAGNQPGPVSPFRIAKQSGLPRTGPHR